MVFNSSNIAPVVALAASVAFAACSGDGESPFTPDDGGGTPTVASVSVSPASATVNEFEGTKEFSAAAEDQDGNAMSGVTFDWKSSDTTVATVNSDGVATAVGNGQATISATASGVTGDGSLTVDFPAGSVEGSIEQTSGSGSLVSADRGLTAAGEEGLTVAAARVTDDGGLEGLRTATSAADGSFTVEDVPTGQAPLLVVARNASGEEVGRALIHGDVPDGGTTFAAPVNGETSVEGHVLSELRSMGIAPEAINTAEIATAIELRGQGTADQVLASTQNLTALAEGVRDYQDIYTEVLSQLGISLDAGARGEAALQAALAYAEARLTGAEERAAEDERNQAIADAYRDAGAGDEAQVQASSAAGTGLTRAAEEVPEEARLDIARAATDVNLLARERQVEAALASLDLPTNSAGEAKAAIQRAQDAIDGAESLEELESRVQEGMDRAASAVEGGLSSRLPPQARDAVDSAFGDLPGEADLESRLQTAQDASAVAESYVSFFSDLRDQVLSAVQSIVSSGGQVNGPATADFFTGIRGLVQVQ